MAPRVSALRGILHDHGITLLDAQTLRRHNVWAYVPALRAVMDIGAYAERPSDEIPGFVDRLTAWLPGLARHECSVGRPGGFVERLRRGTYLPHIGEHVCLELQNVIGFDVAYGRARNGGGPTTYQVLVQYEEEIPGWEALTSAFRLVLAAMHDEPCDVAAEIERLHRVADECKLGPSTAEIVRAARERKIPVLRLTPGSSLIQLGYGKHQKRIRASETSMTSAIAVEVCQEKPLTNTLLRTVGVPVPDGRTVRSADEAWEAANELGVPVVLKPYAGNQGKGVTVGLRREDEIRAAFAVAEQYDATVLVERHVEGADHRLLVVNGRMVAAALRRPAQVVGDGVRTVAELVAETNRDPLRRPGHGSMLTQIRLDEAADLTLATQGLGRDAVPAAGRNVVLRTNANLSTGGTATDVTDDVHPRNARVAELAAQILALDVAGIDMLCRDVRRPLAEQGGAIVEVNAAPGLRMHCGPHAKTSVGRAIVDMLYPPDVASRIPIVAVTGTNGKTTVTRLVAHVHRTARKVVGMTCTDGIYIGSDRIMHGDCSGPRSAHAVLLHPQVEVAVLETARGGIMREGLGYDAVDVGVVTNVSNDHLGAGGIETVEQLARVKQVVIEAVRPDGIAVLNADDPLVAAMAADSAAPVVYFSLNPESEVVAAHLRDGGRAVVVEHDRIVLRTGDAASDLIDIDRLPFTAGARIRFQVANALAAVAATWGAGVNPAIIGRALGTFHSDATSSPGRFNVFDVRGVQVLVDYGHNEAAMRALGEAVHGLGARRTVVVLALPGDRLDRDLRATAAATVGFAEEYVLYDFRDRRGRAPGEVPALVMQAVPGDRVVATARDEREAIRIAWTRVRAGDRLLVIADEVDATVQNVRTLGPAGDEACGSPLAADAERHDPAAAEHAW